MVDSKQLQSLFLTALMVMSVISMAGIGFSEPASAQSNSQFQDVNDDGSLQIWEGSVLQLRTNTDNAATVIENQNMYIDSPNLPRVPANRDEIAVFDRGDVELSFDSGGFTDEFDDESGKLIIASFEKNRQTKEVASTEELSQLIELAMSGQTDELREEAKSRNITFEIVDPDAQFNGDGEYTYTYDATESGPHAAILTRTDSGEGMTVDEDGMLGLDGEATIAGVEAFAVQRGSSSMTLPETVAPGEDITVDAETSLSDDVNHSVIVYHEDTFLGDDENTTIEVTEGSIRNISTDDVIIRHTIDSVNGVSNVTGDGTLFGNDVAAQTLSGTTAFNVFLRELGIDQGTIQNESVGDTELDASATVIPNAGANEEITVETLENWEEGEYRVLHFAEDGTVRNFETSTDTINIEKKPANFNITELSVKDDGSLKAGDDITVNVSVKNEGGQEDTQNVTVRYNGEYYTEAVSLSEGASTKVSFTVDTDKNDVRDQEVTAWTDDVTRVTSFSLQKPQTFELDVIESESDLSVSPQSGANLTVEVENTGDFTGTQDIRAINTSSGKTIFSKSRTIDAGNSEDVVFEFTQSQLPDTGSLEVLVESENDSVTQEIEIKDQAIFEVKINDINEPVTEGQTLDLNLTVENEGSITGEKDVEIRLDGQLVNTTSFELGEDDEPYVDYKLDVPYKDARTPFEDIELEISTEDDVDTRTVDVDRPARFTIEITDANASNLEVGDKFTPTITVENVGDSSGVVNATLDIGETRINATEFDLATSGEAATATIEDEIDTSALSDGTYRLVADANNTAVDEIGIDDQDTAEISIGATDDFEVTIDEGASDSEVTAGEELTVNAHVNNTGGAKGSQIVELTLGSQVVNRTNITRNPAQNESVEFTYETRSADIGDGRTLTVSSDNDDDTTTVDINEPAEFEVNIQSVDDDIIAGETASAVVEVRNVGGTPASTDVELYAGGDLADSETTNSLDENERQVLTLEFTPESAGTETIEAVTSDDLDTETIEVGTAGELDIALQSVTNPVERDGTLTARVAIQNIGDGTVEGETLALDVDEGSGFVEVNTTELPDIEGGEEITERINYEIPSGADEGELPVRVRTSEDEDVGSTEVFDELEDFRLELVDAPSSVLDGDSTTFDVEVTNFGGEDAVQDIELTVDGTEIDNETTSTLGNDESETVSLTFDTTEDAIEIGENEFTISSEDQSITGTIEVEERTPATLEIVSVDAPSEVRQGRELNVSVELQNVGDEELSTGDATLNYSAGEATDTVPFRSVDPGETITRHLVIDEIPEEPFAGTFERNFVVETDDDSVEDTVDVDFRGIQSGIDAAEDGDTVRVAPDFRQPRSEIVVDKQVTILGGNGVNRPVIGSPENDDTALRVAEDDVELQRLTFDDDGEGTAIVAENTVTMFQVDVNNWTTGIDIVGGDSHDLRRVRVSDTETGIRLAGDGDSQLTAISVVDTNGTGILVESDDNTLRGLNLRNPNGDAGIRIEGNDTTVSQSVVRDSRAGIRAVGIREQPGNPGADLKRNNFIGLGVPMSIDGGFVDDNKSWWGFAAQDDQELLNRGAVVVRSGFSGTPSQQQNDPPTYAIDNEDIPTEVTRGEEFTVTADVENTGDLTGDLDAELLGDGSVIDTVEGISLDGGDTESVEFTYTPDRSDGDDIDLRIRTNDQGGNGVDTATGTTNVPIREPAEFSVNITDASPNPVEVGQTLTVDADVGNSGEVEGTETVELYIDGTQVDSESVTLPGTLSKDSNETSIDLTYTPISGDIGTDVPVEVRVPADSDQTLVDIEASSGSGTSPGSGSSGGSGGSPPATGPEVIDDPDEIRDIIDVPEDINPTRAERAPVEFDEETGQARVTFSGDANTESITFGDGEGLEGSVTIAEYDSEPESTGPSPGVSVSVTQIEVPDPDRAATIRMRVPIERLEERGVDAEDLRVNRFNEDDSEWQRLPTELVDETDTHVVLEAETPGFSYFSVSATSEPEAAIDAPDEVTVDEEFTLDGSDSTDEYGEITSYEWSVDGETLTGETVTTAIDTAGDYEITLTVENEDGETDTASTTISVVEDGEPGTGDDGAPSDDGATDDDGEPVDEPAGFGALWIIVLFAIIAGAALLYVRYQKDE